MRAGRRGAVLLAVAALVLGGCAAIPTSSPVLKVEADDGLGQSTVRYSPALPRAGATPQQVVSGYLDAMLAYPVSSGVAEAHLTPEAAAKWSPGRGTQVYTQPTVSSPTRAGDGVVGVAVRTSDEGRLDAQGHFTAGAGRNRVDLRLERVDGQWRVANPPQGTMVTRKYFADYFRPFEIFFLDRTGERLVPDVVHLAVGDQLATSLVASLARGPSRRSGDVQTFVPPVADLRASVPVRRDGVAEVVLSDDVSARPRTEQNRLSAQLVWTLRQVPGLTGVSIVGGSPVLSPGGDTVQAADAWGRYGPRAVEGTPLAVVDGEVVRVTGGRTSPLPAGWEIPGSGVADLTLGTRRVASVASDGDSVRVAAREGEDVLEVRAVDAVTARWSPEGRLAIIDRPGGATRVRLLVGEDVTELDVGALAEIEVDSFAFSPDGGRYAVTGAGSGVLVGTVERDADDRVVRLGDPRPVRTGQDDERSVAWVSGTRLALLADGDGGDQVHTVAIDGSQAAGGGGGAEPRLPDVEARTLVQGSGDDAPRWVLDVDGALWHQPAGGSWRRLDVGEVSVLGPAG